jgi:hypothetical protein
MEFVESNKLHAYLVALVQLHLFDGSTNSLITKAVNVQIHLKTGEITLMTCLVTLLDGSCTLVLGHNWLSHYNPLIDWVKSSITFCTSKHASLIPLSSHPRILNSVLPEPTPTLNPVPLSIPSISKTPDCPRLATPSIEFVSHSKFMRAC